MLAGLAHFGTLRVRDATDMAGLYEPTREQLANFDAIGMTVRFGDARVQLVALNPGFPAIDELRRLILAVEPEPPGQPRLVVPRDLVVRGREIGPHGPRDLFGSWRQTAAILTIAAGGGVIALEELQGRLRSAGCKPFDVREALRRLEARGLVETEAMRVRLHPDFSATAELVAFTRAFLTAMPDYRLGVNHVEAPLHKDVGRYAYGGGDGLPELFGRPVRYRVFVTLAVHGPMRRQDVITIAQSSYCAFERLVHDGWLRSNAHARGNLSRRAVTIANVPARDAFLALLRRMAERWPAPDAATRMDGVPDMDPGPPTGIAPSAFFGTPARGDALLTLAAMGKADVSMLARAVPAHDRQELSRALRMFEVFGIVRACNLDSRRGGFEMDPTWIAAGELRALLDALLEADKRYRGRAGTAVPQMPWRRLRMHEKALKRQRNAGAGRDETTSSTTRRTSGTT
jgi:hypothetical protein